ncbi:polysaccharide deacetylase family protein [Candidatus Pristimantibacillus sp. PTI5]|uniref:polysaccharide deacetylase family protein n=1 Tax=Candidatus Pristimantibacillus sp. PTI5 TaxID=3400422 RepID=UPI003B026941
MDRIKQAGIALVVAAAMLLGWLLTGCTNDNEMNSIAFIVNGERKESKAPAIILNGRLMVPESHIEEVFGKQLEWLTPAPQSEAAYYSEHVAVLMYHDIAEAPQNERIIAVDRFEKQLRLLKQNGFQIIGIEEYERFLLEEGSVSDNAVLITFDDGYESFYKLAFPILRSYGFPAVNFVIVSSIDDRSKPGTAKLSWEQMKEMQKSGMSFRSHTFDMHRYGAVNEDGKEAPVMAGPIFDRTLLKKETEEEYGIRLREDLMKAEERLRSELGNKQGTLAFPYGAYRPAILELTASVGIPVTLSTREGINSRLHRAGYRINGATAGETEEELIAKLKQFGEQLGEDSQQPSLFIDGQEAGSVQFSIGPDSSEPMIVLRDFCSFFGWTLHLSKSNKQVEIMRQYSQ